MKRIRNYYVIPLLLFFSYPHILLEIFVKFKKQDKILFFTIFSHYFSIILK